MSNVAPVLSLLGRPFALLVAAAVVALGPAPVTTAQTINPSQPAQLTNTPSRIKSTLHASESGLQLAFSMFGPAAAATDPYVLDLAASSSDQVVDRVGFESAMYDALPHPSISGAGKRVVYDVFLGLDSMFQNTSLYAIRMLDRDSGTTRTLITVRVHAAAVESVPGPRPTISSDGNFLFYIALDPIQNTLPRLYRMRLSDPTDITDFGLVFIGAAQSAVSYDGNIAVGVRTSDLLQHQSTGEIVRAVFADHVPVVTTIAAGRATASSTDLPHDVTVSRDGSTVAWSSKINHCTVGADSSTYNIWLWRDSPNGIPGANLTCPGPNGGRLFRLSQSDIADDTLPVLTGNGDRVFFVSTADYLFPLNSLRRPTVFVYQFTFGLAIEQPVALGADESVISLSASSSGNTLYYAKFDANRLVSELFTVRIDSPGESAGADTNPRPANVPFEVSAACVHPSGSDRVEVSATVRQYNGPSRWLAVRVDMEGRSYGPFVQGMAANSAAPLFLEVPHVFGDATCRVTVMDGTQPQIDFVTAVASIQ